MSFIGNNAESHEGGALHIQAFGQVKVFPGSEIEFINNTGRLAITIPMNISILKLCLVVFNNHVNYHYVLSLPPSLPPSFLPSLPPSRIGAAIVVDVQRSSMVHSELIYNPNCFLIHSNSTLAPNDWDNVSTLDSQ